MDSCEVPIVGGGPAGSSCAKRLREAGIETVILDKATFPRDKRAAAGLLLRWLRNRGLIPGGICARARSWG